MVSSVSADQKQQWFNTNSVTKSVTHPYQDGACRQNEEIFLKDQKYTKFTIRIFIVISVLAFIITVLVTSVINPNAVEGFFIGLIILGPIISVSVWIIYAAIRWILKAMPDDS